MTNEELYTELKKLGWSDASIKDFIASKPDYIDISEINPEDLRAGIWLVLGMEASK